VTTSTGAMSAGDLRAWPRRHAPELGTLGIAATHGAAPRLVNDGASWISFSSRAGSGRLVRAADGSSQSRADRYVDGTIIIDTRSPTTTEDQLDELMDALRWPITAVRPIRR
jgi:hypothetical protein